MSRTTLPDPNDYEWDFETRGSVGIWYLDSWQGYTDESLEAASDHYRQRASDTDIAATLAVFGDETSLPPETQEYMAEEWTDNVEQAGVERVGFVAEGITAKAVKANVDVAAANDDFTHLDRALAWAQE